MRIVLQDACRIHEPAVRALRNPFQVLLGQFGNLFPVWNIETLKNIIPENVIHNKNPLSTNQQITLQPACQQRGPAAAEALAAGSPLLPDRITNKPAAAAPETKSVIHDDSTILDGGLAQGRKAVKVVGRR